MPVEKEAGIRVIGGTVNQSGSFVMTAEKVGADTMLARIVAGVEAQRSRAPISGSPTPLPLVRAGRFAGSCDLGCGLAILGPTADCRTCAGGGGVGAYRLPLRAGTYADRSRSPSAGAAAGVLIRNAEALERLEGRHLVIDKTGTLTVGRQITEVTGNPRHCDLPRASARASIRSRASPLHS